MRHYVAMTTDELGEHIRATQEEYEYMDFDEKNGLALRLFYAWCNELESAIKENLPTEYGSVWIERVDREAYRFNGFGECIYDDDFDEDDEFDDDDDDIFDDYDEMKPCDISGLCSGSNCSNWYNCHGSK